MAETWALREYIRNTLKVWECGAGEEWRSVGPNVRKIKEYYKESRKGGTLHSKQEVVNSCVGNALYNTLLKGRWGRRREQLMDDLREMNMQEEAPYRSLWSIYFGRVHWLHLRGGGKCDFSKVTPSPARAHDSPPAWPSPQRLKVTHLWFPCQRRAPPLFKLSLILQ